MHGTSGIRTSCGHDVLLWIDMTRLLSFPIGSAGKRQFGHVIRLPNMPTTSLLAIARGDRRNVCSRYT